MSDGQAIAKALMTISISLDNIADALHALGNNKAMTRMGAIEGHSVIMREGMASMATAINDGLTNITSAIENQ